MLHMLGGVDRPTEGKVFINGTNIYDLNNDELAIFRRREIGLIYQFYNLIPVLNVEENITLPVQLDNKKVDEVRLKEIIQILGLEQRKKHLPNQLSGRNDKGMTMCYTIVTESEANLREFKIASNTPIAQALLGHKVGDHVKVNAPVGVIDFEIIKIEV